VVVLTGVSSNLRKDFQALSFRPQANRSTTAARPPRQVQTRLAGAEIAQLIAAYQVGTKINQLATDFGINRNTVSSILRRSGVGPLQRGLSADGIAQVVCCTSQAGPLSVSGASSDCTAETVRQALSRSGVAQRPQADLRLLSGLAGRSKFEIWASRVES
jgi:hypothetical protein